MAALCARFEAQFPGLEMFEKLRRFNIPPVEKSPQPPSQ
jgi:hypothetical protein